MRDNPLLAVCFSSRQKKIPSPPPPPHYAAPRSARFSFQNSTTRSRSNEDDRETIESGTRKQNCNGRHLPRKGIERERESFWVSRSSRLPLVCCTAIYGLYRALAIRRSFRNLRVKLYVTRLPPRRDRSRAFINRPQTPSKINRHII